MSEKDAHKSPNGQLLKQSEQLDARFKEGGFANTLIERTPGIFFVCQIDGENVKLIRWNKNLKDELGYSSEELYGMSPLGFLHPAGYERLAEMIRFFSCAGADAGEKGFDCTFESKNGKFTPFTIQLCSFVYNEDTCLLGFGIDTSTKKKAEEELRKLSQATMQSPVSVVITDRQGTIEYVNPQFTETTGYTSQEAIGQNPRILNSGTHPGSFYTELWETIMLGQNWHGEFCNKKKNGDIYWESASISPILNDIGEITHFVGVKEEITERKKAAKEAEQAKLSAEEASRAKSEFLANMSHEIRTPMNAIIGLTQLALNTKLTKRQKDYLSKIQLSSESLLRILNDILDYSKIEAGKLEFERLPFHLDEVLRDLWTLLNSKAVDKGLELVFDVEPTTTRTLFGDPLRLNQVLINLVSNAIKFSDKGSIVVSISEVSQKGGEVVLRFSVQDNGIGIERNKQKNLFQPFIQADGTTTRKFGGSGLGLSIVHHLVQMMRGEIGVVSAPGIGSTFFFTVRFEHRVDPHCDSTSSIPVRLWELLILIVDDNGFFRRALQRQLKTFSASTDMASSGEEALELISCRESGRQYDLIIIDWLLGGMNGIQTVSRIRQMPLDQQPKVLVVTGHESESLFKEAEAVGVDALIYKPISNATLFNTMEHLFSDENTPTIFPDQPEVDRATLWPVRGANLLLVEDNKLNQQVASEFLEQHGMIVDIANDGREAIKAVHNREYSAVLMDVQMPYLDGYETTTKLREEGYDDLPIIAMTAGAMTGDRERCIEAGMNDYISKPIDPDMLCRTLLRWIQQKSPKRKTGIQPTNGNREQFKDGEFSESLPGLDTKHGLSLAGGAMKIYKNNLKIFVDLFDKIDLKVQELVSQGDTGTAMSLLHTLKGAAGNVGAWELGRMAATLESQLRSDGTMSRGILDEFESELCQVLNSAQTLRTQAPPSAYQEEMPRMETGQTAKEILIELREELQASNFVPDEMVDNLAWAMQYDVNPDVLYKFRKEIAEFSYDKALVTLKQIENKYLTVSMVPS